MNFYDDFPKEKIDGENPYYRCAICKRSVPEINYSLDGHEVDCKYRMQKQNSVEKKLNVMNGGS